MKTKRWVIAAPDRARVDALSREGGYAPLTAAVPGKFSTRGDQAICPPKPFFSSTSTLLSALRA